MVIPLIGTAIELIYAYRDPVRRVDALRKDEPVHDEGDLRAAQRALQRVQEGTRQHERRIPVATWVCSVTGNPQFANAEEGDEPEADQLLRAIGELYRDRAVAMRSVKRDLSLATVLLATLVAASFVLNKTKLGKKFFDTSQGISPLQKAGKSIQLLTSSKRRAIISVGLVVEGTLFTAMAARRESFEARHCAVAFRAHAYETVEVGLPDPQKDIEESLGHFHAKAARYLHQFGA